MVGPISSSERQPCYKIPRKTKPGLSAPAVFDYQPVDGILMAMLSLLRNLPFNPWPNLGLKYRPSSIGTLPRT